MKVSAFSGVKNIEAGAFYRYRKTSILAFIRSGEIGDSS